MKRITAMSNTRYFVIWNTDKANRYFLRCEAIRGSGCGTVVAGRSRQDVVNLNDKYADGHGKLAVNDLAELVGNALEQFKERTGL